VTDPDERTALETRLDRARGSVVAGVAGLDDEQAWMRLVPSLTTPAALVSHLTTVERFWFSTVLTGSGWAYPGWEEGDDDAEWRPDPAVGLAALVADYETACAASRELAAPLDLDARSAVPTRWFGVVTLRFVLVHVLTETAEHVGHLDILRELIDGTVGP
jgi:uncharacterized damage-inducible protein DinB